MKSFRMFKVPVILLSFAGVLILSPACQAQEVNPEHFTSTGVEAVYPAAPHKIAAPKLMQTPPASQARNHQADSTTLHLTASRNSSLPGQPGALAIQEKRKIAPSKPKKP